MSQSFAELLGQSKEAFVQEMAREVKERAGPSYATVPMEELLPRMEAVFDALHGTIAQDDLSIMEAFVSKTVNRLVDEHYELAEVQALITIMREIVLAMVGEAYPDDPAERLGYVQRFENLAHHARQWTFRVYMQAFEARVEKQQRILVELSTPVIQVYENVLVLPLVGAIDTERARRIMEELLLGITAHQAELVIIDITGVPVVDTSVANHLIQTVKAARLLGAKSILVGIRGDVAQTLVHLQVDLTGVVTRSNLQAGIEYALEQMGLEIAPMAETSEEEEGLTKAD